MSNDKLFNMEALDRMMTSHGAIYLSPPLHQSQSPMVNQRDKTHRMSTDPMRFRNPPTATNKQRGYDLPPTTSVSRRNARERKRVRLVNQGFSTLREHVPPGTKNKKLSKVETLRSAIEYIRQLQQIVGIQHGSELLMDENFGLDDSSSVASAEDMGVILGQGSQPSDDLSPPSSQPSSDTSTNSPYHQEDHLIDIGAWFS